MVKLMRLRNYEKRIGILSITIVFLIIVVLVICFMSFYKIPSYLTIQGVFTNDNVIEVMLDKNTTKVLYRNSNLYIDNKKYKFNIRGTITDALTKDSKKYNISYIECSKNKYKDKDIVELVLFREKVSLIKVFGLIWKED